MYEWNRHLEVKSEMALPRLTIVQAVREFSVFVFFQISSLGAAAMLYIHSTSQPQ